MQNTYYRAEEADSAQSRVLAVDRRSARAGFPTKGSDHQKPTHFIRTCQLWLHFCRSWKRGVLRW